MAPEQPPAAADIEEVVFDEPPLQNILIPTDGTEAVLEGVEFFKPIAMCCHADVHLLYVHASGTHTRDRIRSDPMDHATETVENFEEDLADWGVDTQTAVRTGNPSQQIPAYAAENDIDLTIMVTHERSPLDLLRRSVTTDVIEKSDIPVLAISE